MSYYLRFSIYRNLILLFQNSIYLFIHVVPLALFVTLRGIPAHVVIPENTPLDKIRNVKHYEGSIVLSEANMKSRQESNIKVTHETGDVLVPSSIHLLMVVSLCIYNLFDL